MAAFLTGTDRQIAWATTIRARMLSEMQQLRAECVQAYPTAVSAVDEAVRELEQQDSAEWFIDRRDCTSQGIEHVMLATISPFAALSRRVEAIVTGA